MKENIEEVIEFLQGFNDGYTFQQCKTCFKFNEKDDCCNKEKCEELEAIEYLISDYKRVLKENEELKRKYDGFIKMSSEVIENSIPVQKVKDKIEELENNVEDYTFYKLTSEDIRKTIIASLKELLEGE